MHIKRKSTKILDVQKNGGNRKNWNNCLTKISRLNFQKRYLRQFKKNVKVIYKKICFVTHQNWILELENIKILFLLHLKPVKDDILVNSVASEDNLLNSVKEDVKST